MAASRCCEISSGALSVNLVSESDSRFTCVKVSSTSRVSGACLAMGEAAGLAAALALSGNTLPRDIAIEKLQQALAREGAFIGRDQAVPQGL